MSRVSVIIPALNEEAGVGDAISSARQAGADEIIVVDGGSTDRTVQIATESAVVISSSPGRATQQNAGAELARGDVLLFLHADCRISPSAIAEIRERLCRSTGSVAGWLRQKIDHPGRLYRVLETGNHWRARVFKWVYGDQAICIRTDTFRAIGGFPDVRLMEDLLIMKQLRSRGSIVPLQSVVTVSARRWQRRGVVKQTLRNWMLISAAQLGVSPDRLARFYPNDR